MANEAVEMSFPKGWTTHWLSFLSLVARLATRKSKCEVSATADFGFTQGVT
jgi:hypothetical protein